MKLLKIAYLHAKIRYKVADKAYDAALKLVKRYIIEDSDKTEKNVKSNKKEITQTKENKNKKEKNIKEKPSKSDTTSATQESKKHKKQEKGSKESPKVDDLILIEGIGPKIADILNKNGVFTFNQIVETPAENIKFWLKKHRMNFVDPASWAQQARLAAEGNIEDFETLKKQLKNGRANL